MQILAEEFFLAYRKVDLKPHEVLLKVHLPVTREHEYVHEFKQAHRRDDDIAIVNAGMRMLLLEAGSGMHIPALDQHLNIIMRAQAGALQHSLLYPAL